MIDDLLYFALIQVSPIAYAVLYNLFFIWAEQSLGEVRDMLTGVVQVNDLSRFVEMHLGYILDPLCSVAKYHDSLCVV